MRDAALRQAPDIRSGMWRKQDGLRLLTFPGGPSSGGQEISHRHFAVPHRGTRCQAFRRIDDGVGVHAVVAIEVIDGAGLAEMLDAERLDPVAAYAAEPAERGGMAIDH